MRQQGDRGIARAERRKMRRVFCQQLQRVALEIPASVAANSDWNNLVVRRIHRRHHRQRGAQRNFMLARPPPKQNANPESFFIRHRAAAPRPRRNLEELNCSETRDGFHTSFGRGDPCTQYFMNPVPLPAREGE